MTDEDITAFQIMGHKPVGPAESEDGLAPDGTCRYCGNKVIKGEEDFHATTECALPAE